MQDEELTRFACALRDANTFEVGDNMHILSFDQKSHFPNDEKCRSCLLVRDFYPLLFDRIATLKASLLSGVPGTGKSWWIWYAIQRLLNQHPQPAIVWESSRRNINKCVLFKDGKAFVGPITAFDEELRQKSTW